MRRINEAPISQASGVGTSFVASPAETTALLSRSGGKDGQTTPSSASVHLTARGATPEAGIRVFVPRTASTGGKDTGVRVAITGRVAHNGEPVTDRRPAMPRAESTVAGKRSDLGERTGVAMAWDGAARVAAQENQRGGATDLKRAVRGSDGAAAVKFTETGEDAGDQNTGLDIRETRAAILFGNHTSNNSATENQPERTGLDGYSEMAGNEIFVAGKAIAAARDEDGLEVVASKGKKHGKSGARRSGDPRRRNGPPGSGRPLEGGANGKPPGNGEPPGSGAGLADSEGDGDGELTPQAASLLAEHGVDIRLFAAGLELMAAQMRTAHKSELFEHPNVYYTIANFVRRPPTPERLKEFADQEFSPQYIEEGIQMFDELMKAQGASEELRPVFSALYLSLGLSQCITEVKVRTVGFDRLTTVSDAIAINAFERIAHHTVLKHYERLSKDSNIIHAVTHIADALLEQDRYAANLAPDIHYFASELNHGLTLALHLESLADAEESVSYEELREANDKLFQQIEILQRYGMKSAVVPALLPGKTKEWLILDSDTEQAARRLNQEEHGTNFGPMRYAGRYLAHIIGTNGRFLSSRPMYKTKEGTRIGAKVTSLNSGDLLEEGSEATIAFKLMPDGHLATNFGRPIPEILEEAGAGMREYEILRGEILALYADLVTPVTVIKDIVEQELAFRGQVLPQTEGKPRKKPSLYPLILAREHVITTLQDEIIEELETETRQPKVDRPEGPRQKRHMAEHDVIWHLRKINPRFRASPQARDLAWTKHGIILPDYGETYVDSTTRGDLPRDPNVRGHRVRRRQPSDARRVQQEVVITEHAERLAKKELTMDEVREIIEGLPRVDLNDPRLVAYLEEGGTTGTDDVDFKLLGKHFKGRPWNNFSLIFKERRILERDPQSEKSAFYFSKAKELGEPWQRFVRDNGDLLAEMDRAVDLDLQFDRLVEYYTGLLGSKNEEGVRQLNAAIHHPLGLYGLGVAVDDKIIPLLVTANERMQESDIDPTEFYR